MKRPVTSPGDELAEESQGRDAKIHLKFHFHSGVFLLDAFLWNVDVTLSTCCRQ